MSQPRYIFITGGVVSSLGKGVVAGSIGALLEARGLTVRLTKADPYINIDPGTMSPVQHGEVFVTDDGAETDLDLGHYERFTNAQLTRLNSFSTGQIYHRVIDSERRGDYLGSTVQVVPHITDAIKSHFITASTGADVAIIEIGGTIGDIECLPFIEAIRQLRYELGTEQVMCVHLTLMPFIRAAGELKTKPTQHSVKELRHLGIQPDIVMCRADRDVPKDLLRKIAKTCYIQESHVFNCPDVDSVYLLPHLLYQQGLDRVITAHFKLATAEPNLEHWQVLGQRLRNPKHRSKIAIIGKYLDTHDAYKSIYEALVHAGVFHHSALDIDYVDAEDLNAQNYYQVLSAYNGILVPGGFGDRGSEGKILATKYARETNTPFFGICLGMQIAAIEFARHVLQITDATSEEFVAAATQRPLVIHILPEQRHVQHKGASMRLGAYPCHLQASSKAYQAYGSGQISERHRHRLEFNNMFRQQFEDKGMLMSGTSPNGQLVEMIELNNHPWFVGCQFHPELKSRPIQPHPLFKSFVAACLSEHDERSRTKGDRAPIERQSITC